MPPPFPKAYERPELLLPLTPVVAYLASMGLWIPGTLMAVWFLVLEVREKGRIAPYIRSLFLLNPALWLFLILAALSTFWALDPLLAAQSAFRLTSKILLIAVLTLAGLSLPLERLRTPLYLMLLIASGMGLLCSLDIVTEGSVFGWLLGFKPTVLNGVIYSRGSVFHAISLPVMVFGCWQFGFKRTAFIGALIGIVSITTNYSGTARGILLLAGVTLCVIALWPRLRLALAPLLMLALLIMPVVTPSPGGSFYCLGSKLGLSTIHRMGIWDFTEQRIAERPWFGWGMDAARIIPGGTDKGRLPLCSPNAGETTPPLPFLPLHPHNGSLQIWLELGAAGVILAVWSLGRAIQRRITIQSSRWGWATLSGTIVSLFAMANFSFGLWQSSITGIICLTLFLTAAIIRPIPPEEAP